MSGRNWRSKYEKKHGYAYESDTEFIANGIYSLVNFAEVIDFENNPNFNRIMGLAIDFPEGRKTVTFPSNCTLLGKILDGEFILKQNSDDSLMILWQRRLLFLTTENKFESERYEEPKPIKYSSEIIKRISELKDETQDIEKRLKSIGISFLCRADTIGFPDYNSINVSYPSTGNQLSYKMLKKQVK